MIAIYNCEELSSVGSLSIFSTLVRLESLTIGGCKSMHEVINTEETEESEKHNQVIIFPQLKDLVIGSSSNLKSFYGGTCKLKFPNLRNLQLYDLDCLNKFAGSENQSVLFHEEMEFPCLEELRVSSIKDEVMGLWDCRIEGASTPLLNPTPMLRRLTLSKTNWWRHIPPILCKNLSALQFEMFNDEVLLSLGNEVSVWTCSQLPKLKDLCLKDCKSLKDLLRKEDFDAVAALTFCKQLKNLELNDLPRLNIIPLHLFKSLCSLYLGGLSWDYVFSADDLVRLLESLQQLETLDIHYCKNMRVVIQDGGLRDAGLVFKFPRLKEISFSYSSIISFSSTVNDTLCLPLLERIDIFRCDMIQHFWSGPIIAPKLKKVSAKRCSTIKSVLVGNPNHRVELPSLMAAELINCPDVLCFSSGPLTVPNLREVCRDYCPQMQSFSAGSLQTPNLEYAICEGKVCSMAEFGMNLNHLFRSSHDMDLGEEPNTNFDGTI